MVEFTSDWALVVVTVGLVAATAALARFTYKLALESRTFADAMHGLASQIRHQVEVSKLHLKQEAAIRGRPPINGIDEI